MARRSRSDAHQPQQLPKCVDRPMAWVRKGCYRRGGFPWVPKAGSCTFQPLSAEQGARAAVCGHHDAAGLDGLHRLQQRDVPLVLVPDARGANRALELRAPTILRRILMRLRGVRILVPEGTLMCRTHTTQHELSAIAPNVQWVQLFASLGFADIRVGATSVPRHRCRGCAHVHARADARSSMRCLHASACGP